MVVLPLPVGPGHEHHAGGALDQVPKPLLGGGRHAELAERQERRRLAQQAHDHRLAVRGRHGGEPHVDRGVAHAHAEASVLGQSLLGDVEPGHELQPRDECARHAPAVDHLLLQDAIDPEPDAQLLIAGLDVNVRGARLHGVIEHGLQELDDGCVGRTLLGGKLLDVDVVRPQIVAHRFRERSDLVGLAIDRIEGLEQIGLAHQREPDRLLELGLQLVVGVQVGRVGHADQQASRILEQHDGAIAPRERLGEQAHRFLIDARLLQVDERHLQVLRQELVERGFRT